MDNNYFNQNAQTVPPQGTVPPGAGYPPPPVYTVGRKWPPIAGDAFDTVFMILTLVFSVFAVHCVFFAGFFKLGFTVAYVLWFVLESIYVFTKNKPHFTLYALLMGALSLGASGVFALYNDEVINLALLAFIGFANAQYFLLLSKQERFQSGELSAVLDVARYLFVMPFQFFTEPFRASFSAAKGSRKKGKAKGTVQVLIGLAIAIPIAAILIALLSNADAAFKGLINKIFSNVLLTLAKLILGIMLFPLLLAPAFALRYKMPNRNYRAPKQRDYQRFPSAISITILAVVSLVYLVYLFAQLAYFFDAFKGILPENYSASAYARRGFFEMCAICAINVIFIALSMAFAKHESKGSEVCHKVFQIFISLVSLVIAASSFSKMYLYIQLFGLTRKRILTSLFILMLSVAFVCLIVRILVKKFPYMKVIAACCFMILIAVGYVDIDSNLARYNYKLYESNRTIAAHYERDGAFIEELGDSAAESIAAFAENASGDVKMHAQSRLCALWGMENVKEYYSVRISKCDTPLSYNRARVAATKILEDWNGNYHYDNYHKILMAQNYDYEKAAAAHPDYCYEYSYVSYDD